MAEVTRETFRFFEALGQDNTKAFWTENKAVFEGSVKAPFVALTEELSDWGMFKLFRMHRDVRFSKDKSPYKLMQGAMSRESPYRYVHFDKDGVLMAVGGYIFDKEQLSAFRDALQDTVESAAFVRIRATLEEAGLAMEPGGAEPLKTAPRGVDKDHPMIDVLRWKGCIVIQRIPSSAAGSVEDLAREVDAFWTQTRAFVDWLPSG